MFKKSFSLLKKRESSQKDRRESDVGPTDDAALEGVPLTPRAASITTIPSVSTLASGVTIPESSLTIERQLKSHTDGKSPDPLGLKVLHSPGQDRQADIVFVHGLGGSSRMTWSKNRDLSKFWPLQFLSLEPVIKDARILTFGYNANFRPGSGRNTMSILEFAKELLFGLKYSQDDSSSELQDLGMGQRPIVFVVHSMGGLIVKEAYMQGQDDPIYRDIIKAVSAIMFLSTPHRGTNLAETLNRILQVSLTGNSMKFISELVTGSQTLQQLNEKFRHVAPKLEIVSFYETRPTTMFKGTQIMVLEKDSSVLGYPGEVSKPLDADHHGVCKYQSREDPHYVTVRDVLKSLVGKSRSQDTKTTNTNRLLTFKIEELLGITESAERDYNFYRDRWTVGTCNWILEHAEFLTWLESDRSTPQVLWIEGNAASGKSILASFVINHLVQHDHLCHYFFVRFEDKKKRAISTLLRSVACQLAHSRPEYASQIRQLEAAGADLKSSDSRTIWQLLYKQSLASMEYAGAYPIYWVLDGLDEADSPQLLIEFLSEFHDIQLPLRILMVSRRTHEISTSFPRLSKCMATATINAEGHNEDFRRYIEDNMFLTTDNSYRGEVLEEILRRAHGNFLWVHLAVHRINSCQTKLDISHALKDLPPGMEALYSRMARSVRDQPDSKDPTLGARILSWAAYAQRPLSVQELSDALGNDGILEIHHAINYLCSGFVVVDQEDNVALIHETAREYLTSKQSGSTSPILDRRTTHDDLFRRCITRLMDPALRNLLNRDREPALLDYAAGAWFYHLSHGSVMDQAKLSMVMRFFKSQHILTWIQAVAKKKNLRTLVIASRHLNDVVLSLSIPNPKSEAFSQAIELLTSWATDLVKIIGKFGTTLLQRPDTIYKLVPPFCPEESALFQQFGSEIKTLHVSGFTRRSWDDCLGRISLDQNAMSTSIQTGGSRIVVWTNKNKTGCISVYSSSTLEERRRIVHHERVYKMQIDMLGESLVSCGYKTTKIWNLRTGDCIKTVANPATRARPQSIVFLKQSKLILICGEDRCVRALRIDDASNEWRALATIKEQSQEETYTVLNQPTCSALSPDGDMVAFGYRGHPVTVWSIDSEEQVGQCKMTPDKSGMTDQTRTFGEITQLQWHPFNGDIFGLHREGLLFKWNPYEDEASDTVHAGAHFLAVSHEGSLIVTGDTGGTVKVYTSGDLKLVYQLSSQDHVLDIVFSTDSRRLYDLRGMYSNVWEPNALVRLAESSEFSDRSSDSLCEVEALSRFSLQTEFALAGVSTIVSIAAQADGPLYSYGTEDGVVMLCEVGQGRLLEIDRLPSLMPIDHMEWSGDGTIIAYADLSRRIHMKRINSTSEGRHTRWQVHDDFQAQFISHHGHIQQLLFQRNGHALLAVSSSQMLRIEAESHDLVEAALPSGMQDFRWTNHPTQEDCILAFGSTSICTFSWTTLDLISQSAYSPLVLGSATEPGELQLPGDGTSRMTEEALGKALSCPGSLDTIVQLKHTPQSGPSESRYPVLKLGVVDMEAGSGATSASGNILSYTLLAPDIASRVREPLGLLSRGRFIFLDIDRWICSYRLPTNQERRGGRASEAGISKIELLYFLPGDWVTADEARLCTITQNGVLICPRNGDVATVECAKLRR